MRVIAWLLGISYQRVAQLINQPTQPQDSAGFRDRLELQQQNQPS